MKPRVHTHDVQGRAVGAGRASVRVRERAAEIPRAQPSVASSRAFAITDRSHREATVTLRWRQQVRAAVHTHLLSSAFTSHRARTSLEGAL
jgi:hypothetical protein